jgi:hypothetical protein
MALYVPRSFGCFGAACDDIFPPDAIPPGEPGGGPIYLPGGSPGVNVDVSVPESGVPMPMPVRTGLPWWAWLAIGFAVAWIARD